MSSLIEELQRDALDSSARVSDLLRKAKTIAVKLDLPDLEKWVENELNGYPAGDVPKYRIVVGQVKGRNPFHGWQPVQFPNSKAEESFSKRYVFQKAAELESVIASSGDGGQLQIPLVAEAKALLMDATGFNCDFTVMVPLGAAVGILDAVRNALLEWALKLEKSGVRGEGMSFSTDERKKAHETPAVYNIKTIETFTGNMGSGSGNFIVKGNTINAGSRTAIEALVSRIRSNESQLGLEPASLQKLHQALDGIQSEVKKPKASAGRIDGLLASVRNIAEGAVGSLAAQGILYELSKLMN
jgi:hypothetical protein